MNDDITFTGERLHAGDPLFSVDLARHEAAYQLARQRMIDAHRVLDLGSGSGYGTAALAREHPRVVGLDRIRPDSKHRDDGHFLRADLGGGIPLASRCFDLIISFQVIEHLEDPTDYVDAIADLLASDGTALLTTPNILMSDGINPFHVHEYRANELGDVLQRRFGSVEVLGIGATEPVHAYFAARSARIRRIMRIDPLGFRNLLPRGLVEWLFARFAVLVRRQTQADEGTPQASWQDFPIGPADDRCLDLLAICKQPTDA